MTKSEWRRNTETRRSNGTPTGLSRSFEFRDSGFLRHSSFHDLCKSGSWSQCTASKSWRLSMNRPGHRIAACLGRAALKTHALQTLRECRACPKRAKRLECVRFIGAFRLARDGPRLMVPMHGHKAEGAFHEAS